MENSIVLMLVTMTIFCLMFSIGVSHSFQELTFLWRWPGLLLRSLFAVIALVPAVVGLLLWVFELPAAVATGIAILAAAPGAPLTHKRSQMAGGDLVYTASLQLTLALMAVLITPIILSIFGALFELDAVRVSPFKVARQISVVTFLPVTIGLLLQRFAPRLADMIIKPLRMLANALFITLVAVLLTAPVFLPGFGTALNLGGWSTVAIIIMAGSSLTIGHLLGGPSPRRCSSLAISCVARNVGLAFYIAGLSDQGQSFIPTLLTYMILGALLAAPYSVWSKRLAHESEKGMG